MNNCCSDVADIDCHPDSLSSPVALPIPTDSLGKTKPEYISQSFNTFSILNNLYFAYFLFHVYAPFLQTLFMVQELT